MRSGRPEGTFLNIGGLDNRLIQLSCSTQHRCFLRQIFNWSTTLSKNLGFNEKPVFIYNPCPLKSSK